MLQFLVLRAGIYIIVLDIRFGALSVLQEISGGSVQEYPLTHQPPPYPANHFPSSASGQADNKLEKF